VLDFLAVSAGAVVGANLRYWMSRYAVRLLGPVFPYGTLAINVLGSFVLGFFLVWTTERVMVDARWRLLIAVGFCGGYTTFSSYAYETMSFFQQGQWTLLAVNVLGNNLLACAAVLAGMALARVL
jgi:fluoride exporter